MWNNWFMWKQRNEQDRKQDLMRIAINAPFIKYENIEDQVDMAEEFIERIALNQKIKKEDIIEGVCKRWDLNFIMMKDYEKESEKQKKNITPKEQNAHQISEIKATDKYKKKDENTVKEVRRLLSEGKNYSEIARKLHIDRRTVKGIAVNNGFIN